MERWTRREREEEERRDETRKEEARGDVRRGTGSQRQTAWPTQLPAASEGPEGETDLQDLLWSHAGTILPHCPTHTQQLCPITN